MHDPYYHFREDDGSVRDPYGGSRRSRSRSPFRKDKAASKRKHEDDHYRKGSSDSRRFKTYYEGGNGGHGSDKPSHRSGAGEGNRRPSRSRSRSPFRAGRPRDRIRSPYRPGKGRSNGQSNEKSHEDDQKQGGNSSAIPANAAKDAAQAERSVAHRGLSIDSADPSNSEKVSGRDSVAEEASETPQLSDADMIEQRRKRREAIKAKHKNNPPLLAQALLNQSAPSTPLHDSSGGPSEQQSPPSSLDSPRTPGLEYQPGSPAEFAVANDAELMVDRDRDDAANDEGPSAADYDPNLDMQEDRPEFKKQEQHAAAANNAADNSEPQQPKQAKEFDMFADDDDDDMFAPADSAKPMAAGTTQARALDQSLLDNWDYPDGHYRIILGELLDGRYAVQQQIGKGTFATVVRAQDTRTGNSVAVKIACNNETMYKAGQKEMDMLHVLNQNDPDDKKHIIRLLRNFDHKGHMCLVFENLSADLREVLKKFGRNVGLNLKAIRSFAQQMFLSLSHMKKCQILHADLKPDNILVSEKRNLLKICDLGTAAFAEDAEVTPYLVSRFYRAPEVILGMPFEYAIDMWSIGCTLYELYTGRILFAGADNNQMLRVIQESRGKFPIRMLKKSTLAEKHFDIDGNFFSQERDKITGKATLKQMNFTKIAPGKDLRSKMSGNTKGMKPDEVKEHAAFVDLMDKCLQLDPARRISPNDALRHAFILHSATQQGEKAKEPVKVAMKVPGRFK